MFEKTDLQSAKRIAELIADSSFRTLIRTGARMVVFYGESGRAGESCPTEELLLLFEEARKSVPDEVYYLRLHAAKPYVRPPHFFLHPVPF